MSIEFNKPSTYYKGKGRHAGEGQKHEGDADYLLRCAEDNHTRLKYCNSDLVDPECGRNIMGSFEKEHRPGNRKPRTYKFRNNYGSSS